MEMMRVYMKVSLRGCEQKAGRAEEQLLELTSSLPPGYRSAKGSRDALARVPETSAGKVSRCKVETITATRERSSPAGL